METAPAYSTESGQSGAEPVDTKFVNY